MCVQVNGNFSLVYFVNALEADDLAIRIAVIEAFSDGEFIYFEFNRVDVDSFDGIPENVCLACIAN